MINNISVEIYISILVFAIIYYFINNITINKLVSIIILILLSYILYYYLKNISDNKNNLLISKENKIDNDIKTRDYINNDIFYINKFPKELKYLKKDKKMMEILYNIRFIRKFNKTRFSDILLNADRLIKVYVYILSDRYNVDTHITIFGDIRNNILELMYSLVMIIPQHFKHTYGLDPYNEIERTIDEFRDYSRELINILEKYGKIEKKLYYIQDTRYRASNSLIADYVLP